MKRLICAALSSLFTTALVLSMSVALVAAQEACVLEVEPKEAPAGSDFVLRGSGYRPDLLILERAGAEPTTFELDVATDSFEIPIGSRIGNEGQWTATVIVSGTDCRAEAHFHVSLRPTDALDDLLARRPGGLPAIVYLGVVVVGFAAGTLIARLARARS